MTTDFALAGFRPQGAYTLRATAQVYDDAASPYHDQERKEVLRMSWSWLKALGASVAWSACLTFFAPVARADGCVPQARSCTAEHCKLVALGACSHGGLSLQRTQPTRLSFGPPSIWVQPWLLLELGQLALAEGACAGPHCKLSALPPRLPPGRELSVYAEWTLSGGRALTFNLTPAPGHCAPLVHVSF
jgi:hypothetical protein